MRPLPVPMETRLQDVVLDGQRYIVLEQYGHSGVHVTFYTPDVAREIGKMLIQVSTGLIIPDLQIPPGL